MTLTDPADFGKLPILTLREANVLIEQVQEEREANATPGNPDACGEGFRYNGPHPLFICETKEYGKLLLQIVHVSSTGDVAIGYNVHGRIMN